MLISFRVKNFRSIVDTTISLDYAEGKAPNGYKDLDALPFLETGSAKRRVVPCLALYGANASGKTNLIKAIQTLDAFFCFGVEKAFYPNKLHSDCHSMLFEVNFCLNKDLFSYVVEYNRESVIEESLTKNNKILFSVKKSQIVDAQRIVSGSYSIQKMEEILKVECSISSGVQVRSFLINIGMRYAGLNTDVSAVALFFLTSIVISPSNNFEMSGGIDLLALSLKTENAYFDAFTKIEELIRKMDFGIKRMTFNREQLMRNKNGNLAFPETQSTEVRYSNNETFAEYFHSYHDDVHGKEVRFNFNEESDGTQTAFGLFGVMLFALEKGHVVFIDELDRSLHPLVFREIIRLFKDKRYNTKGAQLIFTAHNTDLLDADILRVSEVGIVSKNLAKGTTLARLSDFDDIRNVLNFRKMYLNGEFAGIPFPYI